MYALEFLHPFDGQTESGANGVNDSGTAVGSSYDRTADRNSACLWAPGTVTPTSLTMASADQGATGINNAGDISAYTEFSDIDVYGAFVLLAGTTGRDLHPLSGDPADSGKPIALSETQIVGWSQLQDQITRATVWDIASQVPTDLGALNADDPDSEATHINRAGQIVGYSTTSNGYSRAFLWTPGGSNGTSNNPAMEDLGTLGGPQSQALRINDSGVVVGWSDTATGETHAFAWRRGGNTGPDSNPEMEDLGTLPGHTYSIATAIDRHGNVFGSSATAPEAELEAFSCSPDRRSKSVRYGPMVSLNTQVSAAAVLRQVFGVNQQGQLVGVGSPVIPNIGAHSTLGYRLTPL
jgi:probable HAF family extracellular repeat protein